LVREIVEEVSREKKIRMQSMALAALQDAAESTIVMWFEML
jgi:hypothetical protein